MIRLHPTNWMDYALWLALACALLYWRYEEKELVRHYRDDPVVWRVRSSLGAHIIHEFYVTNRHPVEISVQWTTNVTADGLVVTSEIKTNCLGK